MKSNQHYFEISQQNPEPHLDENYFLLEKHPELSNYISGIKDIKEVLITIKKLREGNEKNQIIEKYFLKLFEVFDQKFANCSELGCFVNACDTTRDLIQKDYNSFKKITKFFLKNRDLIDSVPENWVQAILDSNSSRRKGELGENKLIKILKKLKFKKVENWVDFNKQKICIAQFSDKIFFTKNVKKKLNLKMPLKKQGKKLDLIIKFNKKIFLLEAKHSNVGGGGQNKQISELIEILSIKKERVNIYYISFLDGTYSNYLLGKISKNAERVLKQREEIEEYLKNNPNNFWVNTIGFKNLFSDLIKK
ncbi:hypothetical protein KAI52_00115 [Candidatus Parcubacteria bacterium]|nr:hypothetical protein [Candidatus Parcubacteria bacterium]